MTDLLVIKRATRWHVRRNLAFYANIASIIIKSVLFSVLVTGVYGNSVASQIYTISAPLTPFYVVPILFLLSPVFFIPRRWKYHFLVSVNIAISILLLIDAIYYRAFGTFLSVRSLHSTNNFLRIENLLLSIIPFCSISDGIFFIDIPLFALLGGLKNRARLSLSPKKLATFFVIHCVIFSIFCAMFIVVTKRNFFVLPYTEPATTARNLSPIGYHILDTYYLLKTKLSPNLTKHDVRVIKTWYSNKRVIERQQALLTKAIPSGILAGKNVILLQVESLETFAVGRRINGQEVTPNLNAMLKNSIYFPNIYVQVGEAPTADAALLYNTSLLPVKQGATAFGFSNNRYPSLASTLRDKSYETVAIFPESAGCWNWGENSKAYGYSQMLDKASFRADEEFNLGLSDGSMYRQMVPKMRQLKRPFLAYVITASSHTPFILPEKYKTLDTGKIAGTLTGSYLGAIHYADQEIGHLLQDLDTNGMLDDTVLVIVGDHHAHALRIHSEIPNLKGIGLSEDISKPKVPFIIYMKNLPAKRIDLIGGQVDVMPTLAKLIGVETNSTIFLAAMGRDLLSSNFSFAVMRNGSIVPERVTNNYGKHLAASTNISDLIIRKNYFARTIFRDNRINMGLHRKQRGF